MRAEIWRQNACQRRVPFVFLAWGFAEILDGSVAWRGFFGPGLAKVGFAAKAAKVSFLGPRFSVGDLPDGSTGSLAFGEGKALLALARHSWPRRPRRPGGCDARVWSFELGELDKHEAAMARIPDVNHMRPWPQEVATIPRPGMWRCLFWGLGSAEA